MKGSSASWSYRASGGENRSSSIPQESSFEGIYERCMADSLGLAIAIFCIQSTALVEAIWGIAGLQEGSG